MRTILTVTDNLYVYEILFDGFLLQRITRLSPDPEMRGVDLEFNDLPSSTQNKIIETVHRYNNHQI